jgi:hypothetical protein
MTTQLNILDAIAEGERLAAQKMQQAVYAADSANPGWQERCWKLFVEWIFRKPPGYHFMIEEFRLHVDAQKKLEKPNSDRAFGFLSRKGQKENLIQSAGTAQVKNPKAHRANANVWCVV